MNEKQKQAFNKVLEALSFYANSNIYWGDPIPLDIKLDRKTLHIKHKSIEASEIMQDRGKSAREALFEFEKEFECTYEARTEI